MRILKVTQTYFPYLQMGGPPAKVRAIARALVVRGHQVTVLTADRGREETAAGSSSGQTPESGNQRSEIRSQRSVGGEQKAEGSRQRSEGKAPRSGWAANDHGVEAVYLGTLQNYRATTINPGILRFCASRLGDYDVVHIYGLYDLLGSVVGWFCRRRNIPYVLEPLGMFGPKVRSERKKNVYSKLIGNALFTGAQVVVATSETERAELIAGGLDETKILLRRNGINIDDFEPLPQRGSFRAQLNIEAATPLLVFVGRLSFIKGLDLLVKAFAQIENEAHLIIAGPDDEDGCATEVQRLIEEFRLAGRLTLTGPLYAQAKLEAFVDADFVVLPSRYESFGNVAAEAIACGTPVLVTDQCGIAPLVDGRAGLVVPCDVDGLRDGLQRMIDDKNLLAQLRDGCESVASSLSWDEPVETMERVYESLLEPKTIAGNVAVPVGSPASKRI
jgi:glycosyltransferase involved in cell wall biosynthesis